MAYPWSCSGVTEPDADRGDVNGALVDAFSLVVAGGHSAELTELVDAAFDDVSFLVAFGVKVGWAAAGRAALAPGAPFGLP